MDCISSPDRIRVLHKIGNLGPQGHPGPSPGWGVQGVDKSVLNEKEARKKLVSFIRVLVGAFNL